MSGRGSYRKRSMEERFWLRGKVEFTETCWNWVAFRDRAGYGVFQTGKKSSRAHRVAYELSVGPIPDGMVIDHICHNTSCVKPDHLRVTTQKQNLENLTGSNVNSTSGIRGVTWHKHGKKWRVSVGHNGVNYSGGYFHDLNEAEAAAIALRNALYTHNDTDRHAAALEVAA